MEKQSNKCPVYRKNFDKIEFIDIRNEEISKQLDLYISILYLLKK